ncbi:hypothetical protein [Methermicoccus shengliensis]|uniref:Uncharacterized protein n=1 Tax=Methermicoccus shengliensis TaxID=660064 RepID=A0A832RZZ0_9EURY|nr:hypothetical protein [Methermicoccus shengliensis]HIH70386.1 hypothetical protein [Methermicoccus shengliensis]
MHMNGRTAMIMVVAAVLVLVGAGMAVASPPVDRGKGGSMSPAWAMGNTPWNTTGNWSTPWDESPKARFSLSQRYGALLSARENMSNAMAAYERSLGRYRTLGAGMGHAQRLDVERDYALSRVQLMMSTAQFVRAYGMAWGTQYDTQRIEQRLQEMEQLREQIRSASSPDEVRALREEMNRLWQRTGLELQLCVQSGAVERLEDMLERAENTSTILQQEIEQLSAQEVDTHRLNLQLEQYGASLEQASAHLQRAREMIEAHEGFDDNGEVVNSALAASTLRSVRTELTLATEQLKASTRALREAFLELRHHRAGMLTLQQDDTLHAEGNGTAAFSGRGTVRVVGDVLVRVVDVAKDANISAPGEPVVLPYDMVQYHLREDDALEVNGTSFTVCARGEGIVLDVDGVGSVVLTGNGTYTLVGANGTVSGEWHAPLTGMPWRETP